MAPVSASDREGTPRKALKKKLKQTPPGCVPESQISTVVAPHEQSDKNIPSDVKKKKKAVKRKGATSNIEATESPLKRTKKASAKTKQVEASAVEACAEKPDTVVEDSYHDIACRGGGRRSETLQTISGDNKVLDNHKVWVGDLPWHVSEAAVKKDFLKHGDIVRFDMPKNWKGLPLGNAFIYYKTESGMKKALSHDGCDYHGRIIKVRRAASQSGQPKGDPTKLQPQQVKPRTDNNLTAFIAGLSFDTDEQKLKEDFGECGDIDTVRMLKGPDGKSKGAAFVVFKAKKGLSGALTWNGDTYNGRTIKVTKLDQEGGSGKPDGHNKNKAAAAGSDKNLRTVFVGRLDLYATDLEILTKDFSEAGEIEIVRMLRSPDGSFKGAAFIEFKTIAAAEKALLWDGDTYGGRTITVTMAQQGGKSKDSDKNKDNGADKVGDKNARTVFVGSLDRASTQLKALTTDFSEAGEIEVVRMVKGPDGKFKGAAFIEFQTRAGAQKALSWDGDFYGGRKIKVAMAQQGSKGNDRGESKCEV